MLEELLPKLRLTANKTNAVEFVTFCHHFSATRAEHTNAIVNEEKPVFRKLADEAFIASVMKFWEI